MTTLCSRLFEYESNQDKDSFDILHFMFALYVMFFNIKILIKYLFQIQEYCTNFESFIKWPLNIF